MGAPLEGKKMTGTPGETPMTPNGMATANNNSSQSSSGRGGFKKLFGRRKISGGENSVVVLGGTRHSSPFIGEDRRTPAKSPPAQRNERSSKKGKRWTRLSAGSPSAKREERSSEETMENTIHHDVLREAAVQSQLQRAPPVPTTPKLTRKMNMIMANDESPEPTLEDEGMEDDESPERPGITKTPREQHGRKPPVPPPPMGDVEAEEARRAFLMQKKMIKERDGFCRRVDQYDGQVITVEGFPSYELGSYLGGGVAGVVYEGHRLRPMEDYPVRLGALEEAPLETIPGVDDSSTKEPPPPGIIDVWGCVPGISTKAVQDDPVPQAVPRAASILTTGETSTTKEALKRRHRTFKENQALELTVNNDQLVMIEGPDAPSRSDHYAKAVSMNQGDEADDASISYGFMEETVAIKVLNPVSFRTLAPEAIRKAVVAREGDKMEADVVSGKHPMEERHVWWLVNPNSRNLRTLQRYAVPTDPTAPRRVEVDRGAPDRGLRISLVAAYLDANDQLKELPLTRCIEIWGHVPFGASDAEFRGLIKAIDAINGGHPPPPMPSFFQDGVVPGRVGTEKSGHSASNNTEVSTWTMESHRPKPMVSKRT